MANLIYFVLQPEFDSWFFLLKNIAHTTNHRRLSHNQGPVWLSVTLFVHRRLLIDKTRARLCTEVLTMRGRMVNTLSLIAQTVSWRSFKVAGLNRRCVKSLVMTDTLLVQSVLLTSSSPDSWMPVILSDVLMMHWGVFCSLYVARVPSCDTLCEDGLNCRPVEAVWLQGTISTAVADTGAMDKGIQSPGVHLLQCKDKSNILIQQSIWFNNAHMYVVKVWLVRIWIMYWKNWTCMCCMTFLHTCRCMLHQVGLINAKSNVSRFYTSPITLHRFADYIIHGGCTRIVTSFYLCSTRSS